MCSRWVFGPKPPHLLPTELPRLLLLLPLLVLLGLLRLRLLVAEADLVRARAAPAGSQHAERVPEQALHLLAVRRQGLRRSTARRDSLVALLGNLPGVGTGTSSSCVAMLGDTIAARARHV